MIMNDYLISIPQTPYNNFILPEDEPVYEIDLNTRKINSPQFLGTQTEHGAEIIYFSVDRYFNEMDLANTTCLIQYINANNEGKIYPVPFYDLNTLSGENVEKHFVKAYVLYSNYEIGKYYVINKNGKYELSYEPFDFKQQYYSYIDAPKILFPWVISRDVTMKSGIVKYAIRFYSIDFETNEIVYDLNTSMAQTLVLDTLDTTQLREEQNGINPTELEKIYNRIDQIATEGSEFHWIEF